MEEPTTAPMKRKRWDGILPMSRNLPVDWSEEGKGRGKGEGRGSDTGERERQVRIGDGMRREGRKREGMRREIG